MLYFQQEEAELANDIVTCSKMFYGLTSETTRHLANEMAVASNLKLPASWKASKKAGIDRLHGFMECKPELSLRQPETSLMIRKTAFKRHNLTTCFRNLEEVYRMIKFNPFNVYNLDETGLTTVHSPPKVLAQGGSKQLGAGYLQILQNP
ncbi:tigger transposable element-derived protein 6-like protein [Plakobranchus ocellatus]|uniref:Tigger transposable element-derived protein 6-like protein n=1 Tax=Plakobranchus ocellatus TaxID=259542 RepID=A0AAV3YUK8_9GAST|nr:tigger transposable element-derived protein 6-like protein [Plakobranchus ocellatus]